MAQKEDYVFLGGKSRRYKNVVTGETISRRQYDKLRGINYEKKARFSRARNWELAELRPARGRTSALKATGLERELIAEARREARRKKELQRKEEILLRKLERKAKSQQNKRVKQKTIRPQLLKRGAMGARISFDSYEGYLRALDQMKKMKVTVNGKRMDGVFAYGVGVIGYDDREPTKQLGATLFRLRSPHYAKPISEEELYEATKNFQDEKPYFVFRHWFIHVAYSIEYARKRAGK